MTCAATKICTKCKQDRPLNSFCRNKNNRDGLNTHCLVCSREAGRRYRQAHPETAARWQQANKDKVYRAHLKFKYGVSLEMYQAIAEKQAFCCAICKKHVSSLKKRLYLDHDHKTGQVRGLLCYRCNTYLTGLEDAAFRIQALSYLGGF